MYNLKEVATYAKGIKKLILDNNLLLLLLVGGCDKNSISKYRCTKNYTSDDYSTLLSLIKCFHPEIVITPHVLAEFSYFLLEGDIFEPNLSQYLRSILFSLKNYNEEHISLKTLLGAEFWHIKVFGFSDISLIEATKNTGGVLLTCDTKLSDLADGCGVPNIRFRAVAASELIG